MGNLVVGGGGGGGGVAEKLICPKLFVCCFCLFFHWGVGVLKRKKIFSVNNYLYVKCIYSSTAADNSDVPPLYRSAVRHILIL